MKIGVIGDTHGNLHDAVLRELAGSEIIVHTGDIGGRHIMTALQSIAPLIAVRGNYDTGTPITEQLLPDPSSFQIAGHNAMITHRMITMEWKQHRELIADRVLLMQPPPLLFFFGHTHVPVLEKVKGIWFINPGYCGPDPYEAPPTLIRLELGKNDLKGEIVRL